MFTGGLLLRQQVCSQYMCRCEPYLSHERRRGGGLGEQPWVLILVSTKPIPGLGMFNHMALLGYSMWLKISDIRVLVYFSKA